MSGRHAAQAHEHRLPAAEPGENRLARVWPFQRFRELEVEAEYRREQLRNDLPGTRTLIVVASVMMIPFARTDYALFGATPAFFELQATRIAFILASLLALWFLSGKRERSLALVDAAICVWGLLLALVSVYAASTRPPEFTAYTAVNMVQLMAYYALLPPGTVTQLVPALAFTASFAALLWVNPPLDARLAPTVVLMTVVANGIGFASARSLDRVRRAQFLALRREKQLGESLAQALLKTLHGIVSICAHCKHIRDDAGEWVRVERYLSARSYAEFSHAICPECLERHYPQAR